MPDTALAADMTCGTGGGAGAWGRLEPEVEHGTGMGTEHHHVLLRTVRRWLGAASAGLAGLLLAACTMPQPPSQQDTAEAGAEEKKEVRVVVETATVARHPVAAHYHASAALEPANEAQVVAKTSGVLLKLMVEEGDVVKAGQLLAKIDPERPRLEVQRAEALLRKLEAELARSDTLFERKLIAADMHEKIRYDVQTQRAIYNMARLELSYTDVVAPISGVIAQRQVKLGNLIQLNSSLFRIVDGSRLEATLNVPEREMLAMVAGAPVSLQLDALPGEVFTGRIARVSPVVDAGSGTFRVVCAFDSDARLRAGMFGRISVLLEERPDVLTVPRVALLEDQDEPAVFVLRDGRAVRTAVQPGHAGGDRIEIRAGLEEGDEVVTTGKLTLRDGALVEQRQSADQDGGRP